MAHDKFLSSISKDIAKVIACYVGNFFPLSSINRQFRDFFQKEREAALKKVKIYVKQNMESSFLRTFCGQLYACGENKNDHFGFGDKKIYRQWTRIGPSDRKITDVILDDENSVFIRWGSEGFGAGNHPYIHQARHRDKSHSPWVSVWGPEAFSIVELVAPENALFIRCRDGFSYVYEAGKSRPSKIHWKKIELQGKMNTLRAYRQEMLMSDGKFDISVMIDLSLPSPFLHMIPPLKRYNGKHVSSKGYVFVCCDDGWYFAGYNTSGPNGMNDNCYLRGWSKILTHGEDIQNAVIVSRENDVEILINNRGKK